MAIAVMHELQNRGAKIPAGDGAWTRSLAAGSLLVGAVLIARGSRKAGWTAAAAGAAFALLEEPQELKRAWNNIPQYLQSGKQLLMRVEDFVEDLSGRADKWKDLLEKLERR